MKITEGSRLRETVIFVDATGTIHAGGRGADKAEGRRLHPCHVANAGFGAAPQGVCNDRREAQGKARRARLKAAATALAGTILQSKV